MARGLSELQKFILARAAGNCKVEARETGATSVGSDLYAHEVLGVKVTIETVTVAA